MAAVAGIEALIAFAALLGVQVSAQQQQTTPSDPHHLDNNNSNQSGSNMTEQQQQQQNTTTTLSGQVMMMNQTFTTNWTSLVSGVKVTGISLIDTDHIAVNLRYDGEGTPPGVSVVAITNSSSGTIIGSMMQQDSIMMGQQGEMMMKDMIIASNQQSNSSADQESQQHNQQQMQNSTSATNGSVRIMQSGSNYLEAGWQGQESNSATILVQLDGDIPEGGGHIMVMVFPFLHR
jgi:hypothetical protein